MDASVHGHLAAATAVYLELNSSGVGTNRILVAGMLFDKADTTKDRRKAV